MTAHLAKGLPWTQPDLAARMIHRAIERRRNVVYAPWFWRPIMWGIGSIPEFLFKRLRL